MRRVRLLLAAGALAWGSLAAQEVRSVDGRVVNAATGEPIVAVRVTRAGSDLLLAISDTAGRFRVLLPAGDERLRLRRLGYAAQELAVGAQPGPVVIRLEPLSTALDVTVITAARREERLADAVVPTEVISAREIARSGAGDVAALLERHVGAQMESGVPAGVGVMLQGLGAQRVLILLDGQPVVGRVGGNLDLTRLPLSMIECVEIVKGPQSTLYGSDAMGGVVNLVTRKTADHPLAAGVATSAGSAGLREGSGYVARRAGPWAVRVDGGGRMVALAPGITSDAGTQARSVHLAPRLDWQDPRGVWRAAVSTLFVDESQRYRTGQLYNFSDNSQVNARLSVERRWAGHRIEPLVSWSRYEHLSRRATTPLPASDSGARDVQQLVQVEVPLSLALPRSIIDAGLALRRESITADRVPGGTRVLHAAESYAQATLGSGTLTSTVGSRVSVHERWGTFVAPRVAALWRPTDAVAVRLSAGTGYRAPDFKELYLSFANTAAGYAVEGNSDLTPERSATVTANVSWTGGFTSLRVGAHVTRYRDFIETGSPDASGTYTYRNIAQGRTAGAEWEASAAIGPVRGDAQYAWLRTEDAASGSPLLGRAAHTASVTLSGAWIGTSPSVRLQWTGRTPIARDASTGTVTYRDPFASIDVHLARTLPWGLEGRGGITNVLDRRVEGGWHGFTGRQYFVGLAAELPSTERRRVSAQR